MYRLSPQAKSDIEEIGDHIAEDSPGNAKALHRTPHPEIRDARPKADDRRARPDLRPDLRLFPFGAYLILYRVVDDGAEIVRVVHAARNLEDLV
jgi:toxin ParE1/3/4